MTKYPSAVLKELVLKVTLISKSVTASTTSVKQLMPPLIALAPRLAQKARYLILQTALAWMSNLTIGKTELDGAARLVFHLPSSITKTSASTLIFFITNDFCATLLTYQSLS